MPGAVNGGGLDGRRTKSFPQTPTGSAAFVLPSANSHEAPTRSPILMWRGPLLCSDKAGLCPASCNILPAHFYQITTLTRDVNKIGCVLGVMRRYHAMGAYDHLNLAVGLARRPATNGFSANPPVGQARQLRDGWLHRKLFRESNAVADVAKLRLFDSSLSLLTQSSFRQPGCSNRQPWIYSAAGPRLSQFVDKTVSFERAEERWSLASRTRRSC